MNYYRKSRVTNENINLVNNKKSDIFLKKNIRKSRTALSDITSSSNTIRYKDNEKNFSGVKNKIHSAKSSYEQQNSIKHLYIYSEKESQHKNIQICEDNSSIVHNDASVSYQIDDNDIQPLLTIVTENSKCILNQSILMYHKDVPDASDQDNFDPVMVMESVNDIFSYMRELEIKYMPNSQYMTFKTYLSFEHRTELLNWIVKIHSRLQLLPETLFLAVNIIDRFLSQKIVTLNRFQLVGATALFIAAKYEEINCPLLSDILCILDGQ